MITTSAPGKIVLLGDLMAVYNKLAISAAIDLRTRISIKDSNKGKIYSTKFKKLWRYNKKELNNLQKKYDKILLNKEYKKLKTYTISHPIKYLLCKIFNDIGYKNLNITIDTKSPKGVGSGGSLSCALTLGIYKLFNHKITKKKIVDMSIYHDKIAHGGMPSGIDNSTSTYGGIVSYKKDRGVKKLNVKLKMPILIVENKTSSNTSISVNRINYMLKTNFKKTNNLLNKVDALSHDAISYLKSGNKEKLGELMYKNQDILKKLGISANNIDNLIKYVKKKYNIYGAKLTGGGAGSIIILAENYSKIIQDLRNKNFNTYLVDLVQEGVREELIKIKGVIIDSDEPLYYRTKFTDNLKFRLLRKYGYTGSYNNFVDSFKNKLYLGYIQKVNNLNLFRIILDDINLNLDIDSIKKFMYEFFKIHKKITPVIWAEETLKKLKQKGMKICILTDTIFPEKEKRSWFRKTGINKHIDFVVCSCDIKKMKDNKESYEECLKQMKLKKDEVVFVGHQQYEMDGAKKANIASIAILPISDKNIKSDYSIKSIKELPELIGI